ncbi:hypothetical protein [Secundilactobacillus silagei]|nr:hypothetical protein [Secundilactobacillus silagei]
MGTTSTTANAAKVHSGIPSVLRHTKWHSKKFHMSGMTLRSTVTFYNKTLKSNPVGAMNSTPTYKMKYKYLGHHTYYLVGRIYNNAPAGGMAWKYKVKRYSSHKMYFKDLTQPSKYVNQIYTR